MRGDDKQQFGVFSYVSAEARIASDHPLRSIRKMLDEALEGLSGHFDKLYASGGRPSIAPEKLVRALLLQALYSVRSERQLLAVLEQAHAKQLLSQEHFTVDGTLIQAWANRRSFKEKSDPPQRGTGARGRKLKRDTHESSTDPDSRLYKKSASMTAVPCYLGHVLTENRNGLVISALATQASTTAEREAALTMLDRTRKQRAKKATLGADKAYQHKAFLTALRRRKVKPHVAEYEPNPKWPSFLKPEERNDPGYAISLNKRKLVEKVFGWAKLDRALRQVKLRGLQRVDWLVRLVATAHNLLRMHSLTKPA